MTDIMDRIDLFQELGMITFDDKQDLLVLVDILQTELKIKITEENGGILVTHVAAMFKRNKTGEDVGALDESVIKELVENEFYKESTEVLETIILKIENEVSELEKNYLLLHLCTLLSTK